MYIWFFGASDHSKKKYKKKKHLRESRGIIIIIQKSYINSHRLETKITHLETHQIYLRGMMATHVMPLTG